MGRRAAMLSSQLGAWGAGCWLPLVATGPGLGEFHAHHALLGAALINQLPAPRGTRFHQTVTALTCTPVLRTHPRAAVMRGSWAGCDAAA